MATPPDNRGKPPFPPTAVPARPAAQPPGVAPKVPGPPPPAARPGPPQLSAPPLAPRIAPAGAPARPPIAPPAVAAARPPGAPVLAPSPFVQPGMAPPSSPRGVIVTPLASAAAAPPVAAAAGTGPIPASGPIDQLTPPQAQALARLAAQATTLDYFQVLKIANTASPAEIKAAFYRESRVYHPDRFFHLTDQKTKVDLGTIYKRITEAYYFLRDDQKRRKYVGDITGPDRLNKLRFTEASEHEAKAEVKKQAEEQIGTHPKGRNFFQTAMKEVASENWSAAERSLKTALTYEPSNARYKEELLKVQAKVHDAFKAKGDQFKIR